MTSAGVILACDNCRYSGSTVGEATFAEVGEPCPACGRGRFTRYVAGVTEENERLRLDRDGWKATAEAYQVAVEKAEAEVARLSGGRP